MKIYFRGKNYILGHPTGGTVFNNLFIKLLTGGDYATALHGATITDERIRDFSGADYVDEITLSGDTDFKEIDFNNIKRKRNRTSVGPIYGRTIIDEDADKIRIHGLWIDKTSPYLGNENIFTGTRPYGTDVSIYDIHIEKFTMSSSYGGIARYIDNITIICDEITGGANSFGGVVSDCDNANVILNSANVTGSGASGACGHTCTNSHMVAYDVYVGQSAGAGAFINCTYSVLKGYRCSTGGTFGGGGGTVARGCNNSDIEAHESTIWRTGAGSVQECDDSTILITDSETKKPEEATNHHLIATVGANACDNSIIRVTNCIRYLGSGQGGGYPGPELAYKLPVAAINCADSFFKGDWIGNRLRTHDYIWHENKPGCIWHNCTGCKAGEGGLRVYTSAMVLLGSWEEDEDLPTSFPVHGEYEIGELGPAGGNIFYENTNFAVDGWKYLEAAPVGTEFTSKAWADPTGLITGTSTDVGTGKDNTDAIVAWLVAESQTGKAAQLCDSLSSPVGWRPETDWYLPSKDELYLMFENLKEESIGDFSDGVYWSSSENSATEAWELDFSDGSSTSSDKTETKYARAIRKF